MCNVIFPEDYFMYRDGFASGVVDFIMSGGSNFDNVNNLEYNNLWDFGFFDAYSYCLKQTIIGEKIKLSHMELIIDEFYIRWVGDYNKLYDKEIPAYTLILNNK